MDYSSKSLVVDSEACSVDYPRFYRKVEAKLKKEQRKLSKRLKDGKNRAKQRQKVAKLHEKVANQRKDFLHKLSEQGKSLITIDKWYPSSKLCRFCKNVNKELALVDRTWVCKHCGAELDRDINAARYWV